jgi:hypothetical protein
MRILPFDPIRGNFRDEKVRTKKHPDDVSAARSVHLRPTRSFDAFSHERDEDGSTFGLEAKATYGMGRNCCYRCCARFPLRLAQVGIHERRSDFD